MKTTGKYESSEIVNGNLTCTDCGSTTFRVNTTHSIDSGAASPGRIQMVEIECAECAISQLEIHEDVPESAREYFTSTTYADRGEE